MSTETPDIITKPKKRKPANKNEKPSRMVCAYDPVPYTPKDTIRAPCGIPHLDRALDGGLVRGNLGIIIAGTGVGKTNALLHFALASGYVNHGALVISLELDKDTMCRRSTAMAANVTAGALSRDPANMDKKDKAAVKRINAADYPFRQNLYIAEMTHKKPGLRDIRAQIMKWKAFMTESGKDENFPLVVCIDWFEYIDMDTDIRRSSGMVNGAAVLESVMRDLRRLAVEQNIVIWTAMQANRSAVNRSVIGLDSTASSYAVNTVSDLTLTVCKVVSLSDESQTRCSWLPLEEESQQTDFTRMNLSVGKCRTANITDDVLEILRASSLRFWESEDNAMEARECVLNREWEKLVALSQEVPDSVMKGGR